LLDEGERREKSERESVSLLTEHTKNAKKKISIKNEKKERREEKKRLNFTMTTTDSGVEAEVIYIK
jgi:hypothetical protein